MIKRIKIFKDYFTGQKGASATEYGVIIAGVAIALIFVFFTVTGAFNRGFEVIVNTLNNAVNR
ncbi:MAG: Flp family type IVb pilin [Actinobacteria bacterium]|nr:Flp family type IVb pilin [Actinomycetota bacterium]